MAVQSIRRPGMIGKRPADPAATGESAQQTQDGNRSRFAKVGSVFAKGKGFLQPQVLWLLVLLAAICFEGLGRKYFPAVPATVFYFAKDAVLVVGALWFGIRPNVRRAAIRFFGPFLFPMALAALWTVVEMFNPENQSLPLALVGLRAYWLWWFAPLVIASAMADPRHFRFGLMALAAVSVVVAGFAAYQFALPASDDANRYAMYEGQQILDVAIVSSTNKARVSSTFAYLSGFVAFVTLVPTVLLSMGISQSKGVVRTVCLVGALAAAAVLPMSGSRGAIIIGAVGLAVVAWGAGLVRTKNGRRIAIAGAFAAVVATLASPNAVKGIQDRFEYQDTNTRFAQFLEVLPPYALATNEYPILGVGTGMQQNARYALKLHGRWNTEGETGRHLIELGVPGYLLFWLVRIGLVIALIRAGLALRRAGQGAAAGAALAYAVLTMTGNITFDHTWQALYFLGVAFVLHRAAELAPARAPSARRLARAMVRAQPTPKPDVPPAAPRRDALSG